MLTGGTGFGPCFDITYVSLWDALKDLIEEKCPGICCADYRAKED